jgi:hypothetical protein
MQQPRPAEHMTDGWQMVNGRLVLPRLHRTPSAALSEPGGSMFRHSATCCSLHSFSSPSSFPPVLSSALPLPPPYT